MLEKNKQTCHCLFFLNFPISKTRKQLNGNIYTGCPKWYDMNPYIIHNGSHNESFMVDKTNCYFNSLIGSASVFSTVQYKTGCLITQRNYFIEGILHKRQCILQHVQGRLTICDLFLILAYEVCQTTWHDRHVFGLSHHDHCCLYRGCTT